MAPPLMSGKGIRSHGIQERGCVWKKACLQAAMTHPMAEACAGPACSIAPVSSNATTAAAVRANTAC